MAITLMPVITVGVDLATRPQKTAMATIIWAHGTARVTNACIGVTDDDILAACRTADAVGIDAPFGWPDDFVEYVVAHRDDVQAVGVGSDEDARRLMAYRLTDRVVAQEFGRWPLSASTDRIGLTTMRASSLLAALRDAGEFVDRAGDSRFCEAYPAAALKVWGLRSSSYKGSHSAHLSDVVDGLLTAADWLDLGEFEEACRQDDDVFDSVIAAVIARAHALGHWRRPAPDQLDIARREGWIVVPTAPLTALGPGVAD